MKMLTIINIFVGSKNSVENIASQYGLIASWQIMYTLSVSQGESSLAKTFNTLHMLYSQYLNTKRRKKGHLWQGRFYSSILDENHLYATIRYVENNPTHAQIVEFPEQYRWPSTNEHLRRGRKTVLTHDCFLEDEIKDWLAYLKENEDNELVEGIRKNSMSGRPCGNDDFIQVIERILGRRLRAMSWGRPKKEK